MKIYQIDAQTGIEEVIDADAQTIAEIEETRAARLAEKEAEAQALADSQAAKENAGAKLAALGLTADDLKALGLG